MTRTDWPSSADGGARMDALMATTAPLMPMSIPILAKGMTFPDCKATVDAIKDYALFHNKQVRVTGRGGKYRKLNCTSEGCRFYVQAYRRLSEADSAWYISSFDLAHSDGCTSTGKPNTRQLVQLASFKQALQETPKATVATLTTFLEDGSNGGFSVNQRTVYRAREALRGKIADSQAQLYRRIPSLLREFEGLNNATVSAYDVDDDGRFVRAFVACGVFRLAAGKNQQVFGFEAIPSNGALADVHMYLLGKDGDLKSVLIAAAVCPQISVEHLTWFFQCVLNAGVALQSRPIFTAISSHLRAIEAELGISFHVCTKHLIEDELSKMVGFNQHHHALVWGLQSSETIEEYNNRLQWIATTCGPQVGAYLSQISYERWVLAGSLYRRALYGWRSRDFTDNDCAGEEADLVSQLHQLNGKLPYEFLDGVMVLWVQEAFARSSSYAQWAKDGLQVTPSAQRLYNQEMMHIGEFTVARSSDSLAFVTPVSGAHNSLNRHRVDLTADTCTCSFKQQHGIPCRHMIAVALYCGRMDRIASRFDTIYHVQTYGSVYGNGVVELPLQYRLTESDACFPPSRPRKRQHTSAVGAEPDVVPASASTNDATEESSTNSTRPAQRRRSSDAQARSSAASHRCSKCKSRGHNARSCLMAGSS